MNSQQLTNLAGAAKSSAMEQGAFRQDRSGRGGAICSAPTKGLVLIAGAMATAGCISVNAPDKPIVIELNINIKQEVVYRLAADAGNTIKDNPGIF